MVDRFFVYMLRCSDGSLYTGYTNDLEARVKTHNAGKGAKYTRGRLPVTLVYWQGFAEKSEAMRAEQKLKGLTKAEKEKLIRVWRI